MVRRVVLDCDTGTDDAIAIMLAALHPRIDLVGVTTVWGNHALDICTDNTLRVLEHIGRPEVPVVAGLGSPIAPRLVPYDDRDLPPLPLPATELEPTASDAVQWMLGTLRSATEPVTLVPTGPLTNVAAAVQADPGLVDAVDEVVLMGGAHARGNVTPYAERNVWNDPAAADLVLRAGFARLTLVTLDATYRAALTPAHAADLEALGTPAAVLTGRLVRERIEQYRHDDVLGGRAAPVHDPLTLAWLLDPAILETHPARVTVETSARETYGRTVVDPGATEPNATVALGADPDGLFALLRDTFR